MKIPGTDEIIISDVTPCEGLAKLREMYSNKTIPCK